MTSSSSTLDASGKGSVAESPGSSPEVSLSGSLAHSSTKTGSSHTTWPSSGVRQTGSTVPCAIGISSRKTCIHKLPNHRSHRKLTFVHTHTQCTYNVPKAPGPIHLETHPSLNAAHPCQQELPCPPAPANTKQPWPDMKAIQHTITDPKQTPLNRLVFPPRCCLGEV